MGTGRAEGAYSVARQREIAHEAQAQERGRQVEAYSEVRQRTRPVFVSPRRGLRDNRATAQDVQVRNVSSATGKVHKRAHCGLWQSARGF